MSDRHDAPALQSHAPARPRRRRWVRILLTLAIFLSGLVIGSASTGFLMVWARFNLMPRPSEIPERITQRLHHKLDLTDEQTEQVRAIMERNAKELAELHKEVVPRVKAILDNGIDEVDALLDPEQIEEWHALCNEMRERVRRFGPPPFVPFDRPGPPDET